MGDLDTLTAEDEAATDPWDFRVRAFLEQAEEAEDDKLARLDEIARREEAAVKAERARRRGEQTARQRAAQKAIAARRAARQEKRTRELLGLGLPKERAEALAALRSGPYDVVLKGAGAQHNPDELGAVLQELGYRKQQARNVILRATHIAPEVVALRVHESDAIQLKVALENAGARVRIQPHAPTG